MRLHPRVPITQRGSIDVKEGLDKIISTLDLSFEDALYHVAMVKAQLLREMGAEVPDLIPAEQIPANQHILALAVYGPMTEYGLTQIELYQIITEWEMSESKYMLRYERHGDFEKPGGEA